MAGADGILDRLAARIPEGAQSGEGVEDAASGAAAESFAGM